MTPRLVLFDLDGTIYRGSEPCPFAARTVSTLLASGVPVGFLTNNSAASPGHVTQKLRAMDIPCEAEWVFATGPVAAQLCLDQKFQSVYVIGEPGLFETMRLAGVPVWADHPEAAPIDAVVVGICRTFDYTMLRRAAWAIRSGAEFIATNTDSTFPVEGGRLDPGNGSLVAAVATASGVQPQIIGKPGVILLELAMANFGVLGEETLIVGDRLDTDIAAGIAAGCPTWLVLTGVERSLPLGQAGGSDLSELGIDLGFGLLPD